MGHFGNLFSVLFQFRYLPVVRKNVTHFQDQLWYIFLKKMEISLPRLLACSMVRALSNTHRRWVLKVFKNQSYGGGHLDVNYVKCNLMEVLESKFRNNHIYVNNEPKWQIKCSKRHEDKFFFSPVPQFRARIFCHRAAMVQFHIVRLTDWRQMRS